MRDKFHHSVAVLTAITFLFFAPPSYSADISSELTPSDTELLMQIQHDTFNYFLQYTDPHTGLTLDSSRPGAPASIAATGFALASFAIATTHGWLSYRDAYSRIEKTLETLSNKEAGRNGFFYHFLDPKTGKRIWNSEVSSIDTALFIAGALVCASYFPETKVDTLARKLYAEVKWSWMLNDAHLFSHGWKPEQGFLPYYWDMYSEHLILQALALGSETYPVPAEVWTAWKREKSVYQNKEIIYAYTGSLFTYQYTHAFIDFRKLSDGGINYFENSRRASIANREFCAAHSNEYQTYQNSIWGLSASLGPDGYRAYGAEPGEAFHDGTIAPYGAIGSIVFTPKESMEAIRIMHEQHQNKLYSTYGFKDSFNLDQNWWASEYLGVDQGIIVLMLENFLNGGVVWKRFMKFAGIQRWIEKTGLQNLNNSKTHQTN